MFAVGDVAERLNARDSKSCIRQPRIKGSNPFVSARVYCALLSGRFLFAKLFAYDY